jgi:pimeloyl-ACP methyl ester carboxylesterase
MIEDGRKHLLMDAPIGIAGPVTILQGGEDPDVPKAHARALMPLLVHADARFDLIPDGDHRLSRPQDLERLVAAAADLRTRIAR